MKRFMAMEQLEQVFKHQPLYNGMSTSENVLFHLREVGLVMEDREDNYYLTSSGTELMDIWMKMPDNL